MTDQLGLFEPAAAPIGVGKDLGLVTRGTPSSWATFSPDDRYRYALARLWDDYLGGSSTKPLLVACCLNPSTADHEASDPTMTRLVSFARRERCGGLLIVNAFALRATDPKELVRALERGEDPVGEHNCEVIRRVLAAAPRAYAVVAWGRVISPRLLERGRASVDAFLDACPGDVRCFGTNDDGSPKHPLYLRGDTPLVPWRPQ